MAKANNLNIYKYLNFLLTARPEMKMDEQSLEQLSPWGEKAVCECKN
jgi:hypothetical protein